ncbi:MAG: hypothetical protein GKC02_05480 [Methanomassiliicoccales archaeon]|nr:hypothetical protein [Methanomassiliicoccales archaeon]
MNENLDLERIERKAFSSYMQDGFWDIFIGFLLLGFGLRIYTDNVLFTVLIFVGVGILIVGRRYVTIPRLGMARFGAKRQRRHLSLLVMVLAAVLSTVALWILYAMDLLPSTNIVDIGFSIIVALIFGMIAYYMGTTRIFFYGLVIASIIYLTGTIEDELASILSIASGAIILIVGVVMLVVFIRRYPSSKENAGDAW